MKFLRAFVLFWVDFIVGDSMTLAAGVAAALVVVYVLVQFDLGSAMQVALPAAILVTLVASVRRR